MNEDGLKLLMMFICDGYSSSGKVSKKTAIEMMKYVADNPELQHFVNNNDRKAILNYKGDI